MLNPNKYVAEVFGIKSVVENDGSISIKGITTKTGNFRLTSPLNIDITTEMFWGMEVESNVPFDINHYNNDYTINAQFSVTQNGNYNHKYASLPTIDNGIFINLGKQYLNSQIDINIKMYIGKLQEYEPYTGGKPSPNIEYPQEITNACDKGNIEVNITGRNLLDDRDKTLNETKPQLFKAGTYYVKRFFKPNANKNINSKLMLWFDGRWNVVEGDVQLDDGNIINVGSMGWLGEEQKIILKKDYMIKIPTYDLRKDYTEMTISVGDYLKEYEPYVDGQTLTIPTPNGLRGIPVTTGGNYTDQTGKQWGTDEIDLVRRKYIQRINKVIFYGSTDEKWKISVQPDGLPYAYICLELNSKGQYDTNILCDRSISNHWHNKVVCFINEYKYFSFYRNDIPESVYENADNFKAWLAEHPLEIIYEFNPPIEHDLAPEVVEAFEKLHTYYPATTVTTDEDVNLELEYIADTQKYVDTKIAEISAAIVKGV